MDVAGTSALVTGGASGLGLATVRKLREQGASVAILDLPSSQGATIAKELGDKVIFSPGDVVGAGDVARGEDDLVAEFLGYGGALRRREIEDGNARPLLAQLAHGCQAQA